jgi:hypothetical protein
MISSVGTGAGETAAAEPPREEAEYRTSSGIPEDGFRPQADELWRQDAVVNRFFSIFNCLIFDSNVEAGMPSLAAAPRGPATLPRLFARAASIMSFS